MSDDVGDVERLFRVLVEALAAVRPDALGEAFPAPLIYEEIIPYRTHRARLGFATHEDYELALLRFLAGDGGFAAVYPAEVQEALATAVAEPFPETAAFRAYPEANVRLDAEAVRQALARDEKYAPPPAVQPAPVERPAPPPSAGPVFALEAESTPRPSSGSDSPLCRSCGRTLPLRKEVSFCPFCGARVGSLSCVSCGGELEPAWRFCAVCGQAAGGKGR